MRSSVALLIEVTCVDAVSSVETDQEADLPESDASREAACEIVADVTVDDRAVAAAGCTSVGDSDKLAGRVC